MSRLTLCIHWGFLLVQFITAILALLCWNKSKSIAWKTFILIWVLTFLTETAGKILSSHGLHNLWLYNLFDAIFYPGILLIYADVFSKKKLSWLSVVGTLALVVWAVSHLLKLDIYTQLDTYYAVVASALIIFFALAYLGKLFLDKETTTPLRDDFYYWFSVGFIIYFSYNAIVQGMYTKIIESKATWLPVYMFYTSHLISFVLHICLWTGFRAAFKWMK